MSLQRPTRRALLRASAGSLLAAGLWPGALAAADRTSEEFHFAVVNDTHYRDRRCDELSRWERLGSTAGRSRVPVPARASVVNQPGRSLSAKCCRSLATLGAIVHRQ